MSFVLVVRMKATEGNEQRAAEVARELADASRAEAGCRAYVACVDTDDPGSILIFEEYDDKAAFEAHGASEHFQRLALGELFPLMESRERTFYETL